MKISNFHVFTFPTVGIEALSRFRGIMANDAIMNNLVHVFWFIAARWCDSYKGTDVRP